MTTDRDDAAVRRYREASEVLDERPSATARAAILAAAARHVEAKPRAADAPRAVHRRRWPLAAAAAVLLSTLAVMMAQRTEQEMPTFTAPAERSQDQVAVAPVRPAPASAPTLSEAQQDSPPAPPPAAPIRAPQPGKTNEAHADGLAGAVESGARLKKAAPAAPPEARMADPSATPEREGGLPAIAVDSARPREQAAREPEAVSAEARSASRAAPSAAPAAAPPPAIARAAPAESAAGGLSAASRASDSAKPDTPSANRAARMETTPAPAMQGAMRQDLARSFERTAQDWLEHIVKLRGEGRHAEADAELQRFRARYPDVQVPANALPPGLPAAGTR